MAQIKQKGRKAFRIELGVIFSKIYTKEKKHRWKFRICRKKCISNSFFQPDFLYHIVNGNRAIIDYQRTAGRGEGSDEIHFGDLENN